MAYTGNSIVDYLNSVGRASDYNSRANLAAQNGISNYTGTAAQNTQLLNILNKPTPSTPAYNPPAQTYNPPAQTYNPPAQTYNPPAQTPTPTTTWTISPWSSTGSSWNQQPTLTINGQQYRFNTPQEYANAMQGLAGASQYINEFTPAITNWKAPVQAPTPTPTPSSYTGTSIVDYLNSTGKASDYNSRATLASQMGITNYTGTAEQNTQLLNALKSGTPASPTAPTPSTPTGHTGTHVDTSTYGKAQDTASENLAAGTEKVAEAGAKIFADPNFITTLTNNNPDVLAAYINALAYGGYTVGDIMNDIKRREMVSQGNTAASSLSIISPTKDRQTYYTTDPAGIKAVTDTATLIPSSWTQGIIDPEVLNYGTNAPAGMFTTNSPLLDISSPEYKSAVAAVKGTFYDLANQQLQASTEQEKSIADYNYKKFKEEINTKYGIALSDDAAKAYKQIQSLETSFADRGLATSGLKNEAIDQSLKDTRLQDTRLRTEKLTAEEKQQAATLASSGSAADIQNLINEDKAKGLPKSEWRATKWGLVPSDDVANQYSIQNLQSKFPNATPAEIQSYRDAVLDENGNYRSAVYSKYYSTINSNNDSKKKFAEDLVTKQAENAEKKANAQYDQGLLDPAIKSSLPQGTSTPTTNTSSNQSSIDAAAAQAKAIQKAIDDYKVNNPTPTTPTPTYNPAPTNTSTPSAPKVTTPTYTVPSTPTPLAPTKTGYQGVSIVDYLGSTGKASDYSSRAALAAKNGITGYTGSASQNTQLLTKLRGY